MSTPLQSWSIIILCYNEAGSILTVLRDTLDWLKKNSLSEREIILVNDGSTDGSDELISQFIESEVECPIKYLVHSRNLGIGFSLKNGYQNATKENVIMIPGDGQFNINELTSFRTFNDREFVAFYRSVNESYSFFRRNITAFNKWVNRVLLNVDLQDVNWVKAFKKEAIKKIEIKSKSSLLETEICAKLIATGYKPIEVPSKYLERTSGKSKGASWKILKQAFLDLPRLSKEVKSFKLNY